MKMNYLAVYVADIEACRKSAAAVVNLPVFLSENKSFDFVVCLALPGVHARKMADFLDGVFDGSNFVDAECIKLVDTRGAEENYVIIDDNDRTLDFSVCVHEYSDNVGKWGVYDWLFTTFTLDISLYVEKSLAHIRLDQQSDIFDRSKLNKMIALGASDADGIVESMYEFGSNVPSLDEIQPGAMHQA